MKDRIITALKNVEDPDLKKDIVSLGMIRDVQVEGKKISFTFELTTPACPLKEKLKSDCINAIKKEVGEDYTVELDFTSKVTSQRQDTEKVLSGIKNIIVVSSGKGGVGKSTVATNLAVGLAQMGSRTGLLDADIHGPSIPAMLNLQGQRPYARESGQKVIMKPLEQFGLKMLSIGSLIDEKQPVVWRGPMLSSALRQLFMDTEWGELDYMIVDLPPGTGDIHLTLAQQFPITGAVAVTTPQKVSTADVRKCIEMFIQPKINIPLLGIIENMSYFTPKELPENKYYIFGKGGGKSISEAYNIPLLAQIPLTMGVSETGEEGQPAVFNDQSLLKQYFLDLTQKLAQRIAIVNAQKVTEKEAV